jgi:glycosyltransferase involved in cell wall biosynthesis
MNKPLVTVCLITYNHAQYIAQAIESVLMQETEYAWELVIADDFSTDGTSEILREYQLNFPDKIKLILQEKNVGANKNWIDLLSYPNSKYTAYFEGDDYWIDKHKLQNQVKFLEDNNDFGLVHTNYKRLIESNNSLEKLKVKRPNTDDIFEHLLCKVNLIGTVTVCYRTNLFKNYLTDIDPINKTWKLGDLPFWIYIAKHTKIKYLSTVSSVYRILPESASRSIDANKLIEFEKSTLEIKKYFAQLYNKNLLPEIEAEYEYKLLRIMKENPFSKMEYLSNYRKFIFKNKNFLRTIKSSYWLVNKLIINGK